MKTSSSKRFLMIRGVEVIEATEVVEAVEVIEAAEVHDARGIPQCVNYKQFLIFLRPKRMLRSLRPVRLSCR